MSSDRIPLLTHALGAPVAFTPETLITCCAYGTQPDMRTGSRRVPLGVRRRPDRRTGRIRRSATVEIMGVFSYDDVLGGGRRNTLRYRAENNRWAVCGSHCRADAGVRRAGRVRTHVRWTSQWFASSAESGYSDRGSSRRRYVV